MKVIGFKLWIMLNDFCIILMNSKVINMVELLNINIENNNKKKKELFFL